MNLNPVIIYILSGFALVSLIASLGAILSRKLGFNYGWLAIFSVAVYTYTGYYISQVSSLLHVFIGIGIIGLYDGTVCWNLCRYFNAQTGLTPEELAALTPAKRLASALIVALVFGFIGHSLA